MSVTAERTEALWRHMPLYGTRLYAVLDTARDPAVRGFLRGAGRPCDTLFEGTGRVLYQEAAPYLIALPRRGLATRRLIERGWGGRWGIFVESRAGFAAVRRQLRKSLTARLEGRGTVLFRFYDPLVLRVWATGCERDEREHFLGVIDRVVCEDPTTARGEEDPPAMQITRRGVDPFGGHGG